MISVIDGAKIQIFAFFQSFFFCVPKHFFCFAADFHGDNGASWILMGPYSKRKLCNNSVFLHTISWKWVKCSFWKVCSSEFFYIFAILFRMTKASNNESAIKIAHEIINK